MDKSLEDIEQMLKNLKPVEISDALSKRYENSMEECFEVGQLRSLEADLACLQPTEINEDTLDHLQSSMELVELEDCMGSFAPSGMPEDILARMEQAMEQWESSENVIPFEHKGAQPGSKFTFPVWSSVAAALVIGVISFFLLGNQKPTELSVVAKTTEKVDVPLNTDPVQVSEVPTGRFSSNIVNTSNEGIIMSGDQPHRVVKFHYEEVVQVKDKAGREFEVRVPRVKYILVPAEVN